MTRNLSKPTLAYNALIDAINEQDAILDEAIEERDRLWKAAETLIPVGNPRRRKIVESRK